MENELIRENVIEKQNLNIERRTEIQKIASLDEKLADMKTKSYLREKCIMNIALLIVDVQKAFIGHRKGEKEYHNIFEYINETAALFRKAGKPVITVRDIEEGNDGNFQNVEELAVQDSDIEVLKEFSNSFWKTNLEEILKGKNVDFVVLCGNAAEYCVLATYNGAIERGFGATMLQHGIFACHPSGLIDIYNNRSLISFEVISYMLSN